MIEIATDRTMQRAFQRAHSERGAFVRSVLKRLFGSR